MMTENSNEIARFLMTRAEEKFGAERAAALQSEIEQLAAQLSELSTLSLDTQDEP